MLLAFKNTSSSVHSRVSISKSLDEADHNRFVTRSSSLAIKAMRNWEIYAIPSWMANLIPLTVTVVTFLTVIV